MRVSTAQLDLLPLVQVPAGMYRYPDSKRTHIGDTTIVVSTERTDVALPTYMWDNMLATIVLAFDQVKPVRVDSTGPTAGDGLVTSV